MVNKKCKDCEIELKDPRSIRCPTCNHIWYNKSGMMKEMAKKTSETKKKMYASGELVTWNKGKKHSIETIEILKKINKGKNNPMYNKKHSMESREKISKTKKEKYRLGLTVPYPLGRKKKQETIEKLRIANTGEKNPMFGRKRENSPTWQGGKSFEPYNTEFNKQFKELIKLRDNDSCVVCGSNNRLAVHHIDYNKLNSTKENCISLCVLCHPKTNFNRKYWQEFFQSMLSDRYGYDYIQLNLEVKQ
jgi:hypothetical protein